MKKLKQEAAINVSRPVKPSANSSTHFESERTSRTSSNVLSKTLQTTRKKSTSEAGASLPQPQARIRDSPASTLSLSLSQYGKSYIASTQRKRVGHMLVLGAGWNRGVCRGYAYPIRGGHLYVGSFLECGPKVFVDCTSAVRGRKKRAILVVADVPKIARFFRPCTAPYLTLGLNFCP